MEDINDDNETPDPLPPELMEVDPQNPPAACIICNKPLGVGAGDKSLRILKRSAIQKLRDWSAARDDKLREQLKDVEEITVHDSCRASYSRSPSTQKNAPSKGSKPPSSRPSTRANKVEEFSFTTMCMFCGLDVGPDYELRQKKLNASRRRKIGFIKQNETRQSIITACKARNDHESYVVLQRIADVLDLVEREARYHCDCMAKYVKLESRDVNTSSSAHSLDSLQNFIVDYIHKNDDDCQFSLRDIIKESGEDVHDLRGIHERLDRFYKGEVVFTSIKNDIILTYIGKSKDILSQSWFSRKRSNDEQEDRLKIVRGAAEIVLDDIRKKTYDTSQYKAPSDFLNDVRSDVPSSLKTFLDIIMKGEKKDVKKWDAKVCMVSHMIISAARPRTFISSLLLGLSSVIHKKHGSRKLIDNLSYIGACASYSETMLFEASIVKDPEKLSLSNAFIQFAFDNADHNTATLDGYNTFHVMGGIMIVTPHSSVTSEKPITRLRKLPKAVELGKEGVMELQKFSSPDGEGLNNVIMQIIGHGKDKTPMELITPRDFSWLYGKSHRPKVTKGWNSFMQMVSEVQDFQMSRILSLPIVNNPPSDLDTVYTVLKYADHEARRIGQKHAPVTCDHPLYMKSEFILSNQDPNLPGDEKLRCFAVIGMFHLTMSTSKSISSTMDGSGLRKVFALVFAENSLEAIFAGKAHDRAMRGHKLVMNAIAALIFKEIEFSAEEQSVMDSFLDNLENPDFDIIEALNSQVMKSMTAKFVHACEELQKRSPTANLWIQYFTLDIMLFKIVEAHKRGD
ncbi:hypothetical protein QAD02_002370 [Eretmocerus hayati]|uniref:Uncharacterized protein n=1 Tax=Eretmocerus hayati TaxID=131215 RepID=A0ACC2NKE8_9HYME|nr:hypothetical protein QAD02_002370 [Eretmocerus hayati]